jgi:uncharacterized membrane protein YphA (DoxX/SURF4 family)
MLKTIVIGAGAVSIALALIRIILGLFFVLARFRFFYDPIKPKGQRVFCPQRLTSLTNKMTHCGVKRWPFQIAVAVAVIEVLAGIALIFGFLSVLSAFGLLVILLYATKCTCREKIAKQNPVDGIDHLCCYLWAPEPLYIGMCLVIILAGPGMYSLDALIFN